MYKLQMRCFEESYPLTLQAGAEQEVKENTGMIPRHNILQSHCVVSEFKVKLIMLSAVTPLTVS